MDMSFVDSLFVVGVYVYMIDINVIGDSGYVFVYGIIESSVQGIMVIKFYVNNILFDCFIKINKGGVNIYVGNLF